MKRQNSASYPLPLEWKSSQNTNIHKNKKVLAVARVTQRRPFTSVPQTKWLCFCCPTRINPARVNPLMLLITSKAGDSLLQSNFSRWAPETFFMQLITVEYTLSRYTIMAPRASLRRQTEHQSIFRLSQIPSITYSFLFLDSSEFALRDIRWGIFHAYLIGCREHVH